MIQSFKYRPTDSPIITDIWKYLTQAEGATVATILTTGVAYVPAVAN